MAAGSWPPPGLSNMPNFAENALPYLNWTSQGGNTGITPFTGADAQAMYTGGARGAGGLAQSAASLAPEAGPNLMARATSGLQSKILGGVPLEEASGLRGLAASRAGMLTKGLGGVGIYAAGRGLGFAADQLGAPSGTGDAIRGLGGGAATGFALGGPTGAVIGEAVGGGIEVAKAYGELGDANDYDKTAGQFHRQIDKKGVAGTKTGDAYVRVARQIHNSDQGVPYTDPTTGQATVLPTGTIAEKNAAMKVLVDQMKTGRTQRAANKGKKKNAKLDDLAFQAQASELMAPYAARSEQLGNALADSIMAQVPNVAPQMAPIMQYDADQRRFFGAQVANAYRAMPYASAITSTMDAQLARLAQLNQQAQAIQDSGGSGGGGGTSLAQLAQQLSPQQQQQFAGAGLAG